MGNKSKISYISNVVLLLGIMVSFTSCFKDDDPVILPQANSTIEQIQMGSEYNSMVYYDISTKTMYERDMKSWDLAFSFMDDDHSIHLNGGKGMYIAQSEGKSFQSNVDLAKLKFKWDGSDGSKDSTGIGDWKDVNNWGSIYVVDRGPYYTDEKERYKKLVVYNKDAYNYLIYYSDIDGKNMYYIYIPKYEGKNFSYFTFDGKGHCIDLEPDKDSWDIVFTRNTFTFYDYNPPLPYIVTTVLINPYSVEVGEDSTTSFDAIDLAHANSLKLANEWDAIGWDWKEFDQQKGLYTVKDFKNYVVKDGEGSLYKLRFLDFYDKNRQRGYPKFEFVKLK